MLEALRQAAALGGRVVDGEGLVVLVLARAVVPLVWLTVSLTLVVAGL